MPNRPIMPEEPEEQLDVENAVGDEQVEVPYMADDEPLFEGGPTYRQLEQWKQEHGAVYSLSFDDGTTIFFRPLTRREYIQLVRGRGGNNADDVHTREERICEMVVLWPEEYRNRFYLAQAPAGIPTTIAEAVLERSGFTMSADVKAW